MKFLLSTLLLAIGAAADLRGTQTQAERQRPTRRTLMPAGTECVTYERIVMFEDGSDELSWVCQFSTSDAEAFGASTMELTMGHEVLRAAGASSGKTLFRIGKAAYVQPTNPFVSNMSGGQGVLSVPEDIDFEIAEMDEDTDVRHYRHRQRRRRQLQESKGTTGTMETLVIRIVDGEDKTTDLTQGNLDAMVFTDASCLKSRYHDCSYGQLNIEKKDIVDIKNDVVANNNWYKNVENAARVAAYSQYGDFYTMREEVDLAMYCMPPGTHSGSPGDTSWVAYAYINHFESFYNNRWCGYVSSQMHEVGHNIGLGHSGIIGMAEYADKSDFMGFSYASDDGPDMCFNAAKSYQLRWYEDRVDSIDPLNLQGGSQSFDIIGVANYQTVDGLVSLRLEHEGHLIDGIEWYVGYNHKTGINNGVPNSPEAAVDRVHIIQKQNDEGDPYDYGLSNRIADLGANQEHTWTVGSNEVTLRVNSINGAIASITITNDVAPPTTAPVVDPTAAPVVSPTAAPAVDPTAAPVVSPTTAPVVDPTAAPVVVPTIAPVVDPTAAPVVSPTTAPVVDPTAAPVVSPTTAPVVSPTTAPVVDPTAAPVATTLPPTQEHECIDSNGEVGKLLLLEVQLDDKSGSEFGWAIANGASGFGWYGQDNFAYSNGGLLRYAFCLPKEECWHMMFQDMGNDGICGGNTNGDCYYRAMVDGNTVVSGGSFDSEISHQFCIGTRDVCNDAKGKFKYRKKRRNKRSRKTSCNIIGGKRGGARRRMCNYFHGKTGNGRIGNAACLRTCGSIGEGSCAFLQDYPSSNVEGQFPLPGSPANGETQAGDAAEATNLVPVDSIGDNIFLHSP